MQEIYTFTASAEARMSDDAPSHIPEAFPALTVPPFLKTGPSLAIDSIVVFGFGCSSTENSTTLPRCLGI